MCIRDRFKAGHLDRMGRVEDGTTTTDYDPEETKRHISISTALAPIEWKETKINLIDAPGYFDFVGEQLQAMKLADAAMIVDVYKIQQRARHNAAPLRCALRRRYIPCLGMPCG